MRLAERWDGLGHCCETWVQLQANCGMAWPQAFATKMGQRIGAVVARFDGGLTTDTVPSIIQTSMENSAGLTELNRLTTCY